MPFTQDASTIGIDIISGTTLVKDDLLLLNISAEESISESYVYSLELASSKFDISAGDILNKQVDFWITLSNGEKRYYNGYVRRFSGGALKSSSYRSYTMEVVPKTWFMSKNRNFRIFQNQTAIQIIEQLLTEHNITYRSTITRPDAYPQLTYAVQYQESSLAFISRLMHENGLFYFFELKKGEHKLVLADNVNAYATSVETFDSAGVATGNNFPALPQVTQTYAEETFEHIEQWLAESELFSGTYTQSDFDFESPARILTTTSSTSIDPPGSENELFHYPGGYASNQEGQVYTDRRIEEQEVKYTVIQGTGNYRHFYAGCKFVFASHTFSSEVEDSSSNKIYYAISKINFKIAENSYFNSSEGPGIYTSSFQAIPASKVYFSDKEQSRPMVHGPQTAIVVGPVGEKVHTDQYGRVRVQFHWDRVGTSNENSSCWLRVSQSWAGSGWGAVALPHIGSEVIVSFLNGDPDQPIVTGRVHNATHMPPEAPQSNKEKNILQDDFGNKIVLDATDGSEQILLASPVEDSRIEVGTITDGSSSEGIHLITDGDIEQTVRGTNTNITSGNAYSVSAGTEFSLFGGAKLDISGGIFGSLNAGLNYSVGIGGNYTYTVGYTNAWTSNAWINATNSDILNVAKEDVIIGAGDQLCFVANCSDVANERSIIYADGDKMSFSMGDTFTAGAAGGNTWYEAYGGPSRWDVGILVGAAVSSGLAAGAFALAKSENHTAAKVVGAGAGAAFLATLLAAGYEWWANNRDGAIEPITHDDGAEALKIELNKTDGIKLYAKEKGILLSSGEADADSTISLEEGIGIKYGTTGIITIDDKGKISISSEADVSIESKGNIDFIAKKKVRSKGEAFDFNGVLKHKNFKVLA